MKEEGLEEREEEEEYDAGGKRRLRRAIKQKKKMKNMKFVDCGIPITSHKTRSWHACCNDDCQSRNDCHTERLALYLSKGEKHKCR